MWTVNPARWNTGVVIASLTFFSTSFGLLTVASKTDGRYLYNFATVPLVAEFMKLCISFWMFYSQHDNKEELFSVKSFLGSRYFLMVAMIYTATNNLVFVILKYLDAPTFQVIGNLKIVSTGILFRVFLKRELTILKWMALILLTAGSATTQISTEGGSMFSAPIIGYILALVATFLSGFAGVFTEYAMKRTDESLNLQNVHLYCYGVIFNAMYFVYHSGGGFTVFHPSVFFHGYDFRTVLVVLNLAVSGLLISWIIKYVDTIAKIYANCLAMFFTTVVSVLVLGTAFTLQLMLGIIVCSCSVYLYYIDPRQMVKSHDSLPLGK